MVLELEDITLALIVAVCALVAGLAYFIINYRYRQKKDLKSEQRFEIQTAKMEKSQVDALAERVKKDQADTARQLKIETEAIAYNTRKEMEDYVGLQTLELKTDYQHKFEIIELKLHGINEAIANVITKNADTAALNAKTAERLEKQMSMIQQFEWGRDAKSVPAFMTGEEETQEHKDKPEEGLFKDEEK